MPDLCLIANIVAAHGIAGALRLRSQSDIPGRFGRLEDVYVGRDPRNARPMRVAEASEHGGRVLMRLEGCTTREMAEEFIGQSVYVAETQMEAPPDGRYFVHDLIGCVVSTTDGVRRGELTDVLLLPANDVYVLDCGGREVLVPAVADFIHSVDVQAKTIVVKLVPGLFEDEDAD